MTVAFSISADGGKVGKQVIICKSKKKIYMRCFKRANAASEFRRVSYFANAKSWMQIDIMKKVLQKLNNVMKLENQNILLFMDTTPERPVGKYSKIRVVFLPNNTTSRLQPLDKWSIKKNNYAMRLQGFQTTVMHLILLKKSAFSKLLHGQQRLGKGVSEMTFKNCFAKCDIVQQVAEHEEADLRWRVCQTLQRAFGGKCNPKWHGSWGICWYW